MRASIGPVSASIVTGVLAYAAGTASGAISASAQFVTITATSGANTGTIFVPVTDNPLDDFDPVDFYTNAPAGSFLFTGWDWSNTAAFPVLDGSNQPLLWITQLSLTSGTTLNTVNNERRWGHDFSFAVQAAGAQVDISISTTIISFDTVFTPAGRSDTGFTLTDTSGSAPGATVFGLLPNGYAYEAVYDGGTVFRNYLDFDPAESVGQDQSAGYDGNMAPPGSFAAVGANVSSMQLSYNFRLSADDQASGSTTWVIIPTPGAAGLIGMGLLVATRRHRRQA